MTAMHGIRNIHVDIAIYGEPQARTLRQHFKSIEEAQCEVAEFLESARPMTRDTAPVGIVCTLGHPANKILVVKTEHFGWRYLHNLNEVDPEDFRAGFEIYDPQKKGPS